VWRDLSLSPPFFSFFSLSPPLPSTPLFLAMEATGGKLRYLVPFFLLSILSSVRRGVALFFSPLFSRRLSRIRTRFFSPLSVFLCGEVLLCFSPGTKKASSPTWTPSFPFPFFPFVFFPHRRLLNFGNIEMHIGRTSSFFSLFLFLPPLQIPFFLFFFLQSAANTEERKFLAHFPSPPFSSPTFFPRTFSPSFLLGVLALENESGGGETGTR